MIKSLVIACVITCFVLGSYGLLRNFYKKLKITWFVLLAIVLILLESLYFITPTGNNSLGDTVSTEENNADKTSKHSNTEFEEDSDVQSSIESIPVNQDSVEVSVLGDNVKFVDSGYLYENFANTSTTVTESSGVKFKGVYTECKTMWVVLDTDGKELYRTDPLSVGEVAEWKDAYSVTAGIGSRYDVQLFKWDEDIIGSGVTVSLIINRR